MNGYKLSALLILAAPIAACGPDSGLTPYNNPSLNSANQPVVQRSDYVMDVSAAAGGLAAGEAARLHGWFQSLGLGYGDRIFVDEPAYADAGARAQIAGVAARYGLRLSDGAPAMSGMVQPGSARVIVSRTTASVPGCPNWEEGEINSRTAKSPPNYGCATNSNLAAMIADPNDLVLGQQASGEDAQSAVKAIKVYRDRIPTGTEKIKSEATSGGSN